MTTNRKHAALSGWLTLAALSMGCASPRPAVAPESAATPSTTVAVAAAAPAAPAATPAVLPGKAARAPKAGEVEVCGVGIVTASREDPSGAGRIPQVDRQRARQDLWQIARHGRDPRSRAAALTVAARFGGTAGEPRADAREALQWLARLARESRDPVVYAMAVDSCRALTPDRGQGGECRAVSGWEWARLDPRNAVPWLGVARLAQTKDDRQSERVAMQRASGSGEVVWHVASVADRLLDAIPQDAAPATRAVLAHEARSIGFHLGGVVSPARYCTAEAMRDRGTRQTCEKLAQLMIDRGTGLHDIATARQIGEAAGWPEARVDGLRQEVEKLDRVITAEQRGTYGALSCGALQRQQDWARRVRAMGEVAAARDLVRSPAHAQLREDAGIRRAGSAASSPVTR